MLHGNVIDSTQSIPLIRVIFSYISSSCALAFPGVRCWDLSRVGAFLNRTSTARFRPRQLQCDNEVIKATETQPQLFGLPGGDSVVYFVLANASTVVLSTCDSGEDTDLYVVLKFVVCCCSFSAHVHTYSHVLHASSFPVLRLSPF